MQNLQQEEFLPLCSVTKTKQQNCRRGQNSGKLGRRHANWHFQRQRLFTQTSPLMLCRVVCQAATWGSYLRINVAQASASFLEELQETGQFAAEAGCQGTDSASFQPAALPCSPKLPENKQCPSHSSSVGTTDLAACFPTTVADISEGLLDPTDSSTGHKSPPRG